MKTYWKRLTADSSENDRLKLLWIDDRSENLGQVAWLSKTFGRYFDIYYASVPEEVGASLRQVAPEVIAQYGGTAYELTDAPFDVYLADWDLTAAPSSISLGGASHAKNADAAGLATATLSACHFPRHPAAVIPYSAQWTSLEAHGQLHQAVAPEYVYVAWQEGKQLKADQVPGVLPVVVCGCFRKALEQAARWRHVYFPEQSIADVRNQIGSVSNVWNWLEESHIEYDTAWGRRRVRLAAMWLDLFEPNTTESPVGSRLASLLSGDKPAATQFGTAPGNQERVAAQPDDARRRIVIEWSGRMPRCLDDLSRVVDLVHRYWTLFQSEKSRLRYRLSSILRMDPARRTTYDDLEGHAIAQAMGLRYDDLKLKAGDELRALPIHDGSWTCPPIYDVEELGDGPEGFERQRLSVLMLCILARARQPEARVADEADWVERQWIGQALFANGLLYGQVEDLLKRDKVAEATDLVYQEFCKCIETDAQEDRDVRFRTRYLPKDTVEYLSQLINPLPTTLVAPSVAGHEQLGKGLARRFLSLVELWNDNSPRPIDGATGCEALRDAVGRSPEVERVVENERAKQARYGFRTQTEKNEFPVLIADPIESAAVRRLFETFLQVESALSFLEAVKKDASIPRMKRGVKEIAWDILSLLGLLKNDVYAGVASVTGSPGRYRDHAPLVDVSLFNRVQRKCYYPSNRESRVLQNWARELRWPEERWWNWLKRQIPND